MLVDDHDLVRIGFKLLIESEPDMQVVSEANSGELACQLVLDPVNPIDLIIMDMNMSGISGIEATKRILAKNPDIKILGLSAHEDPVFIRHLTQAGASAYLSKRSAPTVLIQAIREIYKGKPFLDAELKNHQLNIDLSNDQNPINILSEKEFEVFIHLAKGLSVNAIAEILNVSPSTTGTHLYNVKQKLNASTQSDLTLIALRNKLIQL